MGHFWILSKLLTHIFYCISFFIFLPFSYWLVEDFIYFYIMDISAWHALNFFPWSVYIENTWLISRQAWWIFKKWTYLLITHLPRFRTKISSQNLRRAVSAIFQKLCPPIPSNNHSPGLQCHRLVLPVCELCWNWVILYVVFCVWLPWLSSKLVRIIYAVAGQSC